MAKKVLVTGGCGFLGSHICELFKDSGWEVLSYDNLTKFEFNRTDYQVQEARDYNLNYLKTKNIKNITYSVTDINKLREYAQDVDYIIHTAAQPAMTISIEYPEYDLDVNIKGTFNVLQVARERKIPCVVSSTVHIYGNEINNLLTENENSYSLDKKDLTESSRILQGSLSPLHASKGAADLYAQAFINSYGLNAGIFRLTGIYGPRQFGCEDHGWVANFIIRNNLNKEINIYGNGKQTRDILYVKDAAKAFYKYYEYQVPGVYNISGGNSCKISLLQSIKLINKISSHKNSKVNFLPPRTGDLKYFISSCSKAYENLNWKPDVLPEEGILLLNQWVEKNTSLFQR